MNHPINRRGPVEPPPSPWDLPSRAQIAALETDNDLIAVGADLAPGTVLAAYRRGLFPMPEPPRLRLRARATATTIGWWSPALRGVLRLDGLRVSRSLRRSVRDFEIRVDTAFDEVVAACGDPRRPGAWIDAGISAAYGDLHRLGWAHSVEAWQDGQPRRRAVRRRDRWVVRGRVDVPPEARRLEGRAGRARRAASRRLCRAPADRRAVVNPPPGEPRRGGDQPSGVRRGVCPAFSKRRSPPCLLEA